MNMSIKCFCLKTLTETEKIRNLEKWDLISVIEF